MPALPERLVALRFGGGSFHFGGLAAVRVEPIEDLLKRWSNDAAVVASAHFYVFELDTKLLPHLDHRPRTFDWNSRIMIAVNHDFGNVRDPGHPRWSIGSAGDGSNRSEHIRMAHRYRPRAEAPHRVPSQIDSIRIDVVIAPHFGDH